MARTVRRQTFEIPTSSKNYPSTETFVQTSHAGINEGENPFAVDQTSFNDANNVYVDQEYALVNRPPFAMKDDRFVLDRWRFGPYVLQIVRKLRKAGPGDVFYEDGDPGNISSAMLIYYYVLECISHPMTANTEGERRKSWTVGYGPLHEQPEFFCKAFARGIFCWFNVRASTGLRNSLVFFDITPDANGEYAFVDGTAFLYRPIHETVINGLSTIVEGKNVFLNGYIRRHIRSTESSIDYASISSGIISFVDKNGTKEELGTGTAADFDNLAKVDGRLLLHNRFNGTAGYEFKAVHTARGDVFLRYLADYSIIWVSVGGYSYRALPPVADILDAPVLTDDGLNVVVFTTKGIAMCKTVRSTDEDFGVEDIFVWRLIDYFSNINLSDTALTPAGHFLSDTEYVYVATDTTNKLQFVAKYGGNYTGVLAQTAANVADILVRMRILPNNILDEGFGAQLLFALNISNEARIITKVLNREDYASIYTETIDALAQFNNLRGALVKMAFTESTPEGDAGIFSYTMVSSFIKNGTTYSERIDGTIMANSFREHSHTAIGMDDDVYFKAIDGTDDYFSEGHYRVGDVTMPIPTAKAGDVPLFGTMDALWIHSGDAILTSGLRDDERIEIDEPVGDMTPANVVPKYAAPLDDYYFTLLANPEKLYVTSPVDDDLLYADETEAQIFSLPITNLHPLSDTTLGIFTQDEIWYVVRQIDSANALVHSKPIRTKIPFGCRDGDDVITTLDGQSIVFATAQGLAALTPQDFVATTEKSLSYITDTIYQKYRAWYDTDVRNSVRFREDSTGYPSNIKMVAYRYWQIFYRYMDREILLLDVRNMSWWKWTTPYPIRKIFGGETLSFVLQVDFLLRRDNSGLTKSYGGVTFVLDENRENYHDDVLPGTLNGEYEELYGNDFRSADLILLPATENIDWSFTSQRLHLNAPQNYKAIKSIYLNARGESLMHAKLAVKLYRDVFHSQREGVMEIVVNEQRTFVKHVNFMHVVNFQYTLASDAINERLRLDSIGVRYEIKEKLR